MSAERAQLPGRAFFVVGPTGVGKSDFAAALAERVGAEIVGADAFQVYRGMPILSAQPEAGVMQRVRHHLIGEIPITECFDVAAYEARARERLKGLAERSRAAVVVGGTGLYIRALTHGLSDLPAGDQRLREELSSQSLEENVKRLWELDPAGAATLDLKNPRRVIRALEVCLLAGRPFSELRTQAEPATPPSGVLLTCARTELYRRIDERTVRMFNEGVIEEVRALDEVSATAEQAIGLREIRALLAGELDREACVSAIQQRTRNYAKRQLTWFNRESWARRVWVDQHDELERAVTAAAALINGADQGL